MMVTALLDGEGDVLTNTVLSVDPVLLIVALAATELTVTPLGHNPFASNVIDLRSATVFSTVCITISS